MTNTTGKGRLSKAAQKAATLETDLTKMTRDERLEALRIHLQAETDAKKLETMAAEMIGELLDIGVAVAKSGYQAGGDGGTTGREGRRLRIETKKYSDTTSLDERELLGEMDHALHNDPALEGWILVATRNASEQLETQLVAKGERLGVPVVIVDWKAVQMPTLAALCATYPGLVGRHFSAQAQALAESFTAEAKTVTERVRRELQGWQLGFETLRRASHDKLRALWDDPRQAQADFGQDVAGGARVNRIRRALPFAALETWWSGRATEDAPAMLLGYGGAGKTWAAFDWLSARADDLPVIITAPASTGVELEGVSEAGLKTWLADRLQTLDGRHDRKHWRYRVDRLLARPAEEGPTFVLLLDGINQESTIDWLRVIKVFLGSAFAGRLRVIVTTRPFHRDDRLGKLVGLTVKPEEIEVPLYDLEPGGELDQMLAFQGLTREALPGDLLGLARTPRLFDLVVRFGPRLVGQGQVTVHRLLWEYGRDSLGVRAGGGSFSEAEWRDWLGNIAGNARDGVQRYGRKDLGQTLDTTGRTESEVFQRLSDIVDGRFASQDQGGGFVLDSRIVDHALAAALLTKLAQHGGGAATLSAELNDWLDPIAGLDQRAEILRAAVSIQVETDQVDTQVTEAVLSAWIQGQNVPDTHRPELNNLGRVLLIPLMTAIERSAHASQASARAWALEALSTIARDDLEALALLVPTARRWLSTISRGLSRAASDADAEQIETARVRRVMERLGFDRSGPAKVLDLPMQVVDRDDEILPGAAIKMLEDFPRALILPAIEAGAIAVSASGTHRPWEGLWWSCLLNEIDPQEARKALRELASTVRARTPEPEINPNLPATAAAKLLRLAGELEDLVAARGLEPASDPSWSYEADYLPRPAASLHHRLEHRHAGAALADTGTQLHWRISRAMPHMLDPTFAAPAVFIAEIIAAAKALDLSKLDRAMGETSEDHFLEQIAVPLARWAPAVLREILQDKIAGYGSRSLEARYWSGLHVADDLVALDGSEVAQVAKLRMAGRVDRETDEAFTQASFMVVESRDLPAMDQWARLIEADLAFIPLILTDGLRRCGPKDLEALFDRYADGSPKTQRDLLLTLSVHASPISRRVRDWVASWAMSKDDQVKGVAYHVLWANDAEQFGRELLAQDWRCAAINAEDWIGRYGSRSVIVASKTLPFEQVVSRIAPSQVLEAVRHRGAASEDVVTAARVIGRVLNVGVREPVDLGADLAIHRAADGHPQILSIRARDPEPVDEDAFGRLRDALEPNDYRDRAQRAVDVAMDRIEALHGKGVELLLSSLGLADLELVFDHASPEIERWLEGMDTEGGDFDRRVRMAEGVYLAVCEVLLGRQPERGVRFWRRLRAMTQVTHRAADDIDELFLLPFRVASSPAVNVLRRELYEPPFARTDGQLFNVVHSALIGGCEAWLLERIAEDKASPVAWRQRRAEIVSAWTPGTRAPPAWPEGECMNGLEHLRQWADEQARGDQFARHWWKTYQDAKTPAEAIAAWRLFRAAADNRALAWLREQTGSRGAEGLDRIKAVHEIANWQDLVSGLGKKSERLRDRFLNQSIAPGYGLWREVQ